MKLSRIGAVAGRDFRGFFDQPTAYILLVVFLAATFFFFFRSAFLTAQASLRPMFDLMPWLLLFFVPAVTMRSIAEERASGTIELVLAQPIREIEYLLGKFFGALGFLGVAIGATVAAWFALAAGGDPLVGVAIAQYGGTLLAAAAFVAIGIWASAMTRNQITAFILALAVNFTLIAITLPIVLVGLPPSLGAAAQRLGLMTHYQNITRGVLDLRDVLYFLGLVGVWLGFAYLVLQRARRNPSNPRFRALQLGVAGIVAVAITVNLLGQHIRGRWDLTPGGAYTLSEPTRDLLRNLDDVVTIRLFASGDLPSQAELVRRDVEDLLGDFDAAGGDDVRVLRRRPTADNEDGEEAERLGVPAVRFNVVGQDELQVSQGFLGIVLEYADASEVIPWIREAGDLEYRLATAIQSMTRPERTVVGLLDGFGTLPQDTLGGPGPDGMLGFARALTESYRVVTVGLAGPIPDSVAVLVVAGPAVAFEAAEAAELQAFLARGGNLFLMYQHIGIAGSQQFTEPVAHPALDALLAPYGIRVGDGMLIDLRSNQPLTIDGAQRPFPLFPVTVPASDHPIVAGLTGVSLAFASPLDLSGADTTSVTPLLASTEFGTVMPPESPLDPNLDWSRLADPNSLRPRAAAAAVLPPGAGAGGQGTGSDVGGRIVLVGDAGFIENRIVARAPENLVFARNAVDWLAADESLIGIRAKRRQAPPLLYPSAARRDAAKYLTLIGVPVLFVLFGVVRLVARRRRGQRSWAPGAPDTPGTPEEPAA